MSAKHDLGITVSILFYFYSFPALVVTQIFFLIVLHALSLLLVYIVKSTKKSPLVKVYAR